MNKFAAVLKLTQHPLFADYEDWPLVAMREALEHHQPKRGFNREKWPTEAWLPAAAIWVSMLGQEMYALDNDYTCPNRLVNRGRGGPLWDGQQGFCRRRWDLWKQRFFELSEAGGGLDDVLRKVAREGGEKMVEVERNGSQDR